MNEWSPRRGKTLKWLVRYRTLDGSARQRSFPRIDTDQAFQQFLAWVEELRQEIHSAQRHGRKPPTSKTLWPDPHEQKKGQPDKEQK
jgi:hypothetical protein